MQTTDIEQNINNIANIIAHAAVDKPLSHNPCHVIAASKTQDYSAIETAIKAGITHFGENRLQEAQTKWHTVKKHYPDTTLHFIGPIQSNKAEDIVALCDVIQTVDRPKLIDALSKAEAKLGLKRQYMLQINIGEEPQKAGCPVKEAQELYANATNAGLNVTGLMCIPPAHIPPAPYFARMVQLKKALQLDELSIGMSEDYATAVRFGATYVRIGTALFGPRKET